MTDRVSKVLNLLEGMPIGLSDSIGNPITAGDEEDCSLVALRPFVPGETVLRARPYASIMCPESAKIMCQGCLGVLPPKGPTVRHVVCSLLHFKTGICGILDVTLSCFQESAQWCFIARKNAEKEDKST